MAEAIAAVGLAGSIITLLEAGKAIVCIAQEIQEEGRDGPSAISDAVAQVSMLLDLVDQIKNNEERPTSEQTSEEKTRSRILQLVVDGCTRQLRDLEEILAQIRPGQSRSAVAVTRKAWQRMRKRKDVLRIQQALETYKTLLTLKLVHQSHHRSSSGMEQHRADDRQWVFLPSTLVPKFIGRQEALQAIDDSWAAADGEAVTQRNTVIIGMGGQGKTQLALEYCQRSLRSKVFHSVFWLDATSPVSIVRCYRSIASKLANTTSDALNDKAATEFAMKAISRLNFRWLMVLDNFDNPKMFQNIFSYLPLSPDGLGSLLFTSRLQDMSSFGTAIFLGGLTEEEGLELFFHRLARLDRDNFSQQAALSVINRFDRLPLAIDQCAAYIRRHGLDFTAFEEIYHQQASRSKMWTSIPPLWGYGRHDGGDSGNDDQVFLNISTTFELSLQHIEDSSSPSKEIGHMMSFLSLFDRNAISEEMAMHVRNTSGLSPSWLLSCYTDGLWNKARFQDIIVNLYGLGILQSIDLSPEWSTFTLHPMVQEWLKLRIDTTQRKAYAEMAVDAMERMLSKRAKNMDTMEFHRKHWLLTNLDVARDSARQLTNDNSVLSCMQTSSASLFAAFYVRCERLDSAIVLYHELLARYEGTNDSSLKGSVLDLYHDMATCHVEQGKYGDAEEMYRKALQGKTKMLGPDHESTLLTARQLGMTYRRSLHYSEGEELLHYVINRAKSVHGTGTLLYLVALNSLAVNLRYQGHLDEAECNVREAVQGVLQHFGEDHHAALFMRRCLGLVLRDQGRTKEAAETLRVVLNGQERLLGPLNSSTLCTVRMLEGIYSGCGDDAQAQEMREKMQGEIGRMIYEASCWSTDR